jgi:hypothetical protein
MEKISRFQDSSGRKVSAALLSPTVRTDKIVTLCHGELGELQFTAKALRDLWPAFPHLRRPP